MEPSAELEAVVRRIFEAINVRDFPTVRNLQSDDPGAIHIGTDPDEWWTSYREAIAVFEAQLREFETIGVQFEIGEIAAYSEGTVGWAACRPRLVFGDGSTTTLRFTGVLHLEEGIWRSVQSHLSVGATNEETVGYEMTTTIETLAAAVQEERPDLAEATGADGTVTIAFSDIEGSTELAVRLGDQKWLDLLRWHESVVENAVTREGGRVVKSLGDGHMLVFPSATRGLRTAIEIQRSLREPHDGEALRLRIGLHTGEVLQHANDLFGRTVIMAARVAAAARGAEILTSSGLFELTETAGPFEFGSPRMTQLKGIQGEHPLFPLIWDETATSQDFRS